MTPKKPPQPDPVSRAVCWMRRHGRVRWESLDDDQFRVSTPTRTHSVTMTGAQFAEVQMRAGAMCLETM